jgi:hypothetical protein
MNVEMTNIVYKRLANNRLAILGNCTRCSAKLLKTRVMPTFGISKKKLTPLFSDARKKHGAIKNLSVQINTRWDTNFSRDFRD